MGKRIFFMLLALCAQCPAVENLRIYYSSNRQGEIEPCGCQGNPLGGLDRLATFLEKEKRGASGRAVLFVDSGDTFFPSNKMIERKKTQQVLEAKLIAGTFKVLGLDAFTPGERDFAGGVALLKDLVKRSGGKLVTTNLVTENGELLGSRYELVKKDGFNIALLGLVDEGAFTGVEGVRVTPAMGALKETLKAIKTPPDLVVVLSHLGLTRDKELAESKLVDLIVGSHSMDPLSQPVFVGKTAIVQPKVQGHEIGYINIKSKDLTSAEFVAKPLDSSITGSAPQVGKLIRAHREAIRKLGLGSVATPSGQGFVANPHTCRGCHAEQTAFWENTQHASAYLVLYAKNQHFDPECIGCHSLGFGSRAGFEKIAHPLIIGKNVKPARTVKAGTPFIEEILADVFKGDAGGPLDSREQRERYQKLKKRYHENINSLFESEALDKLFVSVQCEHCHGTRVGHPQKSRKKEKVSLDTCRKCHKPPNAPEFDPASIAKVACPLIKK